MTMDCLEEQADQRMDGIIFLVSIFFLFKLLKALRYQLKPNQLLCISRMWYCFILAKTTIKICRSPGSNLRPLVDKASIFTTTSQRLLTVACTFGLFVQTHVSAHTCVRTQLVCRTPIRIKFDKYTRK